MLFIAFGWLIMMLILVQHGRKYDFDGADWFFSIAWLLGFLIVIINSDYF